MSGIIGSRFNIRGSGLVGSLGTDGQVFTSAGAGQGIVPEDAGGGGAFTLLNATTLDDTATSITVDGHYSATYDNYMAQVYLSPDATCDLKLQYTTSGGSARTGSNYRGHSNFAQSWGGGSQHNLDKQWGEDHVQLNNATDTVVSDDHGYNPSYRATWWIWQPLKVSSHHSGSVGSFKHMMAYAGWDGDTAAYHFNGVHSWYDVDASTTAITGFKIFTSTGNLAEGKIILYGIAKS